MCISIRANNIIMNRDFQYENQEYEDSGQPWMVSVFVRVNINKDKCIVNK